MMKVPFQVPLEVNIVLIGFNNDGGYRYTVDAHKLEEFLRISFPSHRPSCLETSEPLDIEHHIVYNVFPAGQPELIALEKALKEAMVPAGTARESDYGREVPLFEVDATAVEPVFQKLYSYIFDMDNSGYNAAEMDRPVPSAIFIVNFDKVRMDPRNKEIDLDSLMYGKITQLTEEEMKRQEGEYIYRYRYNGGGASQVWLRLGTVKCMVLFIKMNIQMPQGLFCSFVLSLADVDPHLMMEDESLVWISNDVVIVLQHQNEKIPLRKRRRHAIPSQAQRHILAGLASAVGGLSAPYEKASHVHERPIVNWLWSVGCHPFGPFSNTSQMSQMLQDVALRNAIYARVDSALHRIRDTSEGKKNKSSTELWLEKFYKKKTNLHEPLPHELVERLEWISIIPVIRSLVTRCTPEQLRNFTKHYLHPTVCRLCLVSEKEKMKCCDIEYRFSVESSQTLFYGGIKDENIDNHGYIGQVSPSGKRAPRPQHMGGHCSTWLSCPGSEEIEGVEGLKDNDGLTGLTGLNIKYWSEREGCSTIRLIFDQKWSKQSRWSTILRGRMKTDLPSNAIV
ncbi:hypothetical protein CK203_114597 [Vitis vinifera]|uniref:DUF7906 domain-containing protein n=1 Tax=Vitis vinifera TaxID=29760 RepID=A0A438C894_VITVI|nr:hypothetical protein CK203_114597 [Vitis vinifera]